MKITYINLKNFIGFKSGLGVNEIELDLSNTENRIILLTGENGCGKTTLLSCLHPFSNNGSMDIRNDNSLIIPNKEGYKEIHYQSGNDSFIIKHYYTPKSTGTHSVKSYIEKNNIELNPNGNVTSFRALVKQELDMEPDYLKLMRLGTNVSGFIDAKSTERKSYVGKILEDVDLFLKYHKQTTSTVRELKSIISHTSDKLNKLNIGNADEFNSDIDMKSIELDNISKKLDNVNGRIAVVSNKLTNINPDKDRLSELKKKMNNADKKTKTDVSSKECEDIINNLNLEHIKLTSELKYKIDTRTEKLDELSDKLQEKNNLETLISSISMSREMIDTTNEVKRISNQISEILSTHSEFEDDDYKTYNKSDLENTISLISSCNEIGETIKSYNHDSLKEIYSLQNTGHNIKEYIKTAKSKILELSNDQNVLLNGMVKELSNIKLDCDDTSCPLFRFWNKYKQDVTEDISIDNLHDIDFYEAMSLQLSSIDIIDKNIIAYSQHISILHIELQMVFNIGVIIKNLCDNKDAIDITPFNILLNEADEFDYYKSLKTKREDLRNTLSRLQSNSNLDFYNEQLSSLSSNVLILQNSIKNISIEVDDLQTKIKDVTDNIDEYTAIYDVLVNKESYELEIKDIEEQIYEYSKLTKEYGELLINKNSLDISKSKLSNDITTAKYRLKEFKSLTSDMIKLNKKLSACLLIQRSLSTKEGMPLKFIETYFNNANSLTNQLLYSVYGNNLQIDKFVINADSFTIPYTVRNVKVPDVIYSSQGEKSFISIALSFALASQSLSKYNIMLLDEVDSPLDTSNREKFIDIIEKQCDIVDAEQIFLISHNNMFNMYPVDVINMRNEKNNEIQLANYINLIKK